MRVDSSSSKMYIEGILSYIKGCELLAVSAPAGSASILLQESQNPNVYTKLSCFLPWIAEQYNMEYDNTGITEAECEAGTGNKDEIAEAGECRCACSAESLCRFPFYFNGKYYDQCTMLEEDNFILPVFRCPVCDTVNKINGTNSYTYEDLVQQQDQQGICPQEGTTFEDLSDPNAVITLDPSYQGCNGLDDPNAYLPRLTPLVPCKNNCKGVQYPVVAAGTALLAAAALGATSFAAPATVVGGVAAVGAGAGGMMLAETQCLGPLYCTTRNGQCCEFILVRGRFRCPRAC